MLTVLRLSILGLFLLFTACGETDFSGNNTNHSDNIEGEDPLKPDEQIRCPKHPQNILVLDFKSGWWAGDGGDFFNKLLTALTYKCKIKFEYHHITINGNMMKVFPGQVLQEIKPSNIENGFIEKDWNKYTQVWFLSGSAKDSEDILVSGQFFKDITNNIYEHTTSNLFIGTGYGSITHSNALLKKLGDDSQFATDLPEGRLLNPGMSVEILSTLNIGEHLNQNSPLFVGVSEIADNLRVSGTYAQGDYISKRDADCKIQGKNTEGKDSLALTNISDRRIVLDAGLQRYYALFHDDHEGTYALLRNIIRYLAD